MDHFRHTLSLTILGTPSHGPHQTHPLMDHVRHTLSYITLGTPSHWPPRHILPWTTQAHPLMHPLAPPPMDHPGTATYGPPQSHPPMDHTRPIFHGPLQAPPPMDHPRLILPWTTPGTPSHGPSQAHLPMHYPGCTLSLTTWVHPQTIVGLHPNKGLVPPGQNPRSIPVKGYKLLSVDIL